MAKGREVSVEVHHCAGVTNWSEIEATVRMYLLTSPEDLRCLCKACHGMEHDRSLNLEAISGLNEQED
jgi:predicted HNH restriction endonuclease